MARLWVSGFELNSLTAGIEWDTITGSPTIDATTKKGGAYSLRANASNAYVRKQIYSSTKTTLEYMKANVYFAAFPTSGFVEIMGFGTSGARTTTIGVDSDGKLGIYSAGTLQGTVGTALNTGQWYTIEFKGGYGVSATREIKVDEVSYKTASFTNTTTWNYIEVGLRGTANSADIYIDDVVFDSAAFAGASDLLILRPSAAGDSSGWTPSAGSNYATVDETPPNDDTDYVSTGTDEAQDLYATADPTASISSIAYVYVGARWKSTNGSFCNIRLQAKESGSTSTSAELAVTTTNVYQSYQGNSGGNNPIYAHILSTKPSGGSWTEAALDALQIGYNVDIIFSNTATVTAAWAYVEYTPLVVDTYSVTKSLQYTVLKANSITKSLKYTIIGTPTAVTKSLTYDVTASGEPVTIQKSLTYAIGLVYSREEKASLPTDDTDLSPLYSASERADVATDDGTRVTLTATDGTFFLHEFRKKHSNNTDEITVTVDWQGKNPPSGRTAYLQIYNFNSAAWETLDSNSAAAADTDFTLTGNIDLDGTPSNYYNGSNEVVIRVYQ